MKKLSLDLDDLKVESFDTAAVEAPRGTVHAAQAYCCYCCCCCCCCTCGGSCGGTCYGQYTCAGSPTCVYTECGTCNTCQGQYTCDPSQCNGSCESCNSCYVSCYYSDCGSCWDSCDYCPSYAQPVGGDDRIPCQYY